MFPGVFFIFKNTMNKYRRKVIIGLGCIPVIALAGMILFSPYSRKEGFSYKLIMHTVEINASADSVFRFLGDSDNASRWSVFVNHIVPLNTDEVADGQAGSERRCFKEASERGLQWDELITMAEPSKRRQLVLFNMKGFAIAAEGLATEQLYEQLAPQKTRLSFTLFYKDREPSFIELLKTWYAAYEVKSIFKKNMNNIKNLIETGSL